MKLKSCTSWKKNVANDAVSRLPMEKNYHHTLQQENNAINEIIKCPITFDIFQQEQQNTNIKCEEIIMGSYHLELSHKN